MKYLYLIFCFLISFAACENVYLKAAVVKADPFVFVDNTKQGNERFYGFCFDLLDHICQVLYNQMGWNITIDFYEQTSTGAIINDLIAGKADLGVASLRITSERQPLADFSVAYLDVGYRLLILKPAPTFSLLAVFEPFHYLLWVAILGCAFCFGAIIWIFDRLSPYGSKRTRVTKNFNLSFSIFNALKGLAGMDTYDDSTLAVNIVIIGFNIFSLIVISTYTANLAAFLTNRNYNPYISKLEDIKDKKAVLGLRGGTAVEEFFNNNPALSVYRNFTNNNFKDYPSLIQALRDKTIHAAVFPNTVLDYEVSRQCDLMGTGDIFGPGNNAFPFQLNSTWTRHFSNAILQLREFGTLDKLYQKWWFEEAVCGTFEQDTSGVIKLDDFVGAFLLFGATVFIGFTILILEYIFICTRRICGPKVPACTPVFDTVHDAFGIGVTSYRSPKDSPEELLRVIKEAATNIENIIRGKQYSTKVAPIEQKIEETTAKF